MSLINLSCPHCGGLFALDNNRPLQTYWTCPYCSNRALIQLVDGQVRLRGILRVQTGSPADHPEISAAPSGSRAEHSESSAAPSGSPADHLESSAAPGGTAAAPAVIWPPPPAQAPIHRTLSDYIAEADARSPEPAAGATAAAAAPPAEPDAAVRPISDRPPVDAGLQQLLEQLETSAKTHQLPRFNTVSRKIADALPEDPRTYIWRALLIEDADGFARATWATPWWYLLTPRQKSAQIAQHFYTFNTALQYSQPAERENLIRQTADLLVRQAVDHLTEKAQIRCSKRWFRFRQTFRGRYRKSDLREARDFCDAISRIDGRTCPLAYQQVLDAVRTASAARPKKLARRLSRFSF